MSIIIRGKDVSEFPYFRHFKKNQWYKVLGIAEHTETGEAMVVYQAMYGSCKVYVRPFAMFVSKVDREKYPDAMQEYRLEHILDLEMPLKEFMAEVESQLQLM